MIYQIEFTYFHLFIFRLLFVLFCDRSSGIYEYIFIFIQAAYKSGTSLIMDNSKVTWNKAVRKLFKCYLIFRSEPKTFHDDLVTITNYVSFQNHFLNRPMYIRKCEGETNSKVFAFFLNYFVKKTTSVSDYTALQFHFLF